MGSILSNTTFMTPEEEAMPAPTLERDPTGRDAHSPGAKLDAGKNRAGLVIFGFARAIAEVCKVGTFGANKYTPNGWMAVPNGIERYTDALFRHLLKHASGEREDPDTGERHLAHAAWNALAILDLTLRETEETEDCILEYSNEF